MHSEEAAVGLKSCWRGRFHFVSQLDGCLESCGVTAGAQIIGNGVWLCFMCCPLQGGFNLQPTHEPVHPLNLNPKKLSVLTSDKAGYWHYQLDSYQMKLQVLSTASPICVGSVMFGIRSGSLAKKLLPGFHHPQQPKTQVVAWRSSDVRDQELDWVSTDVARLHLRPPEIPAAVELDELKELYKKK